MLKLNYYNFYFYIKEVEKYIIYNAFSNRILEFEEIEWQELKHLSNRQSFDEKELNFSSNDIDTLKRDAIILEADFNEFEAVHKRFMNANNGIASFSSFDLTIIPTINCNMGCPYCFEGSIKGVDQSMKTISEKTMEDILNFLNKEFHYHKTINPIRNLNIMWFGGEPLICFSSIVDMTKRLREFANKNEIQYRSTMTTNGLLLNVDTWKILKDELKVNNIQITIDGDKLTHNRKRPLKSGSDYNYDRIIDNLKNKPDGITVTLRIHLDKEIKPTIGDLIKDLEKNNIWPTHANEIDIQLGYKHFIKGKNSENENIYYSEEEYYKELLKFRQLKLDFYNNWAQRASKKNANLRFRMPELFTCSTARNPYGLVIDQEGYVYKCLMKINHPTHRLQHISQIYDIRNKEIQKWMNFDSFEESEECKKCKYYPICDSNCPRRFFDNTKLCTSWKYILKDVLNEQLKSFYNDTEKYKVSSKDQFEIVKL